MKTNDEKENLVERILEIEVEMFLAVPTETDTPCRSQIDDMRLHRRSQFAGWSVDTCRSYLADLEEAQAAGRNLLMLKYARMENRVPPLSDNPLIPVILDCFVGWQKQILEEYPNVMNGGRELDGFKAYLSSELETYSPKTLSLLNKDIDSNRRESVNMTQKVYEYMAQLAGYNSLDEMEKSFSKL